MFMQFSLEWIDLAISNREGRPGAKEGEDSSGGDDDAGDSEDDSTSGSGNGNASP